MSITPQGHPFRYVNIIAYFGQVCLAFQLPYTLMRAFCVAIGFYEPKDCPPQFGRRRDASWVAVLNLLVWSFTQFVTSLERLACGLRFQPGIRFSSYTQLYAGFIVSGVLHVMADAMIGMEYWPSTGLARHAGIDESTSLTCIVGYIWVFSWFSVSMSWYLD